MRHTRQNKFWVFLWTAFHALAILPFLATLAAGSPLNIDSDLFNMMPKSGAGKAMQVADAKLSERTSKSVVILASHQDFYEAKNAAEKVFATLSASENFKSVSLYSDISAFDEVTAFIQKYKWNLLDAETIASINSDGGAEEFASAALSKAYGMFSFSPLEYLEDDPFLLGDAILQNYLRTASKSGMSVSPRDGVLATEFEGKWYVLLAGVLSEKGAALASKQNAVTEIYDVCSPLETDGVRFVYSGTPFHSHKSSSSASREISTISTVSFVAVIILCWAIFGSPMPILCSLASIFVSVVAAFCATRFVFGKIHLLTLVFGTSLIGSCIDYSLHFFVNWKANTSLAGGQQIRRHLMTGLLLSLLSTEICYLTLAFAPFNLLKQMAAFSIFGILSSFLTVTCLYPLLKVPQENRQIKLLKFYRLPSGRAKIIAGRAVCTVVAALSVCTIAIFHKNVRIKNDLTKLYSMEGRVRDDTILAAKVLQYSPGSWFVVRGESVAETLALEEHVCEELFKINAGKERGGFLATTLFVPSVEAQKKSRAACERLLDLAEGQYEQLGYEPSHASELRKNFFASEQDFVLPENDDVPEALLAAVQANWLGFVDGKYYSLILPAAVPDEVAYGKIADENENVFFQNKVSEMALDLDKLTRTILMLFAVASVVIFVALKFFYSWRQTLKIISIPLLTGLVVCSVFAATNTALEFFSITGMVLVFGLGLDYVIYMVENDKRSGSGEDAALEPFAIFVSFLTTAISFGALALSAFMPVHLLGMVIFLGIVTAFVCTLF